MRSQSLNHKLSLPNSTKNDLLAALLYKKSQTKLASSLISRNASTHSSVLGRMQMQQLKAQNRHLRQQNFEMKRINTSLKIRLQQEGKDNDKLVQWAANTQMIDKRISYHSSTSNSFKKVIFSHHAQVPIVSNAMKTAKVKKSVRQKQEVIAHLEYEIKKEKTKVKSTRIEQMQVQNRELLIETIRLANEMNRIKQQYSSEPFLEEIQTLSMQKKRLNEQVSRLEHQRQKLSQQNLMLRQNLASEQVRAKAQEKAAFKEKQALKDIIQALKHNNPQVFLTKSTQASRQQFRKAPSSSTSTTPLSSSSLFKRSPASSFSGVSKNRLNHRQYHQNQRYYNSSNTNNNQLLQKQLQQNAKYAGNGYQQQQLSAKATAHSSSNLRQNKAKINNKSVIKVDQGSFQQFQQLLPVKEFKEHIQNQVGKSSTSSSGQQLKLKQQQQQQQQQQHQQQSLHHHQPEPKQNQLKSTANKHTQLLQIEQQNKVASNKLSKNSEAVPINNPESEQKEFIEKNQILQDSSEDNEDQNTILHEENPKNSQKHKRKPYSQQKPQIDSFQSDIISDDDDNDNDDNENGESIKMKNEASNNFIEIDDDDDEEEEDHENDKAHQADQNQKIDTKLQIKILKATITYRLQAHQFSYNDMCQQLDAHEMQQFTYDQLQSMFSNEPFELRRDQIQLILRQEILLKKNRISLLDFKKKMKKVFVGGDIRNLSENQLKEIRNMRKKYVLDQQKIIKSCEKVKSSIKDQKDKKFYSTLKNQQHILTKKHLIKALQMLKYSQFEIEWFITQASLCSIDCSQLAYKCVIEKCKNNLDSSSQISEDDEDIPEAKQKLNTQQYQNDFQ